MGTDKKMGTKWQKTKYRGVRYRKHPTRKHGVKYDQYFSIRYQVDGERMEEGFGWASEGKTAEGAFNRLCELKENAKKCQGPSRLSEQREQNKEEKRLAKVNEMTFNTFFSDTYLPQAKDNKSHNSYRNEKSMYKKWICPVIGDKPLKKVSPLDLERIKKNMSVKNLSPRSIQYCLAVIRQVFNLARILNLYEKDNPVSKIKKPSVDNRRMRFLTKDEANHLLNALKVRSQQVHDVSLISLRCGLRAGEIFNLKWKDLLIDKGLITVRDTKTSKNRKGYMTQDVKEMFDELKRGQPEEYIFKDNKGKPQREISKTFDRVINDLNLNKGISDRRDKVVFHTLRHTYASWLVENGTDLYTVKELLGHSTIAMTERYSHLGQNTMQDAVKNLEKFLNTESKTSNQIPKRVT